MCDADLIKQWEAEEQFAFQGWDFSHIDGRRECPEPPWDYRAIVQSHLKYTDKLLDMGTGGGEFLLTIGHPCENTYATEAYTPNFELCERILSPLGITVAQTYLDEARLDKLPFENDFFDVVINRHESFDLSEVNRVLKHSGYFITQQVGNKDDCEFMQRLNDDGYISHSPSHTMENYTDTLTRLGYQIIKTDEVTFPVKFHDFGALVYHAKIITWAFPGFSVNTHLDKLFACQREIEKSGFLQGTGHRFLIVAKKI